MPDGRERFHMVIADIGDPLVRRGERERDAHYRLRGVLKGLLRGYGFRCESVAPVPPPPAAPPATVNRRRRQPQQHDAPEAFPAV